MINRPTANFEYVWEKVEPIHPSRTRFSNSLAYNRSKDSMTLVQIDVFILTFEILVIVYVKYLWEWLDEEIDNLRKILDLGTRV